MPRRSTKAEGQQPAPGDVYVVVKGINYGDPEVRREAGEEVSDIPEASLDWLREQGHIRLKGAQEDGR